MSAILVALLLFLGALVGFFLMESDAPVQPRPKRTKRSDQLDMTDDMVLYGEVTGDPFYDIM